MTWDIVAWPPLHEIHVKYICMAKFASLGLDVRTDGVGNKKEKLRW